MVSNIRYGVCIQPPEYGASNTDIVLLRTLAESSGERPTTPKSSSRPVVGASDQRDHQATAKTSPAN